MNKNQKSKSENPVLIVYDEKTTLLIITNILKKNGLKAISCQDSRAVMDILKKVSASIETVLLDLKMPHIGGENLLERITGEYPDIPVIIVTGSEDAETAVRCMKAGSFDYIVKPIVPGKLITAVNRAKKFRDLKRENQNLKLRITSKTLKNPEIFGKIITQNEGIISIFRYIEAIAHTSYPILIMGETGVGKELFARAIHAQSCRSGDMVSVNVAELDDNVFSDTLFGHARGAFTGAEKERRGLIAKACGGSLLLDEIGDLRPESQVKLLRLIQECEYFPLGCDEHRKTDARIIVSTNKDIWNLHNAGKFREDLIY